MADEPRKYKKTMPQCALTPWVRYNKDCMACEVDVLAAAEYPDKPNFFVAAVNPRKNKWPPPNFNT